MTVFSYLSVVSCVLQDSGRLHTSSYLDLTVSTFCRFATTDWQFLLELGKPLGAAGNHALAGRYATMLKSTPDFDYSFKMVGKRHTLLFGWWRSGLASMIVLIATSAVGSTFARVPHNCVPEMFSLRQHFVSGNCF